jgi:hypothetical protein
MNSEKAKTKSKNELFLVQLIYYRVSNANKKDFSNVELAHWMQTLTNLQEGDKSVKQILSFQILNFVDKIGALVHSSNEYDYYFPELP